MAEFRQTSFAGGEFASTLWSRSELERFATGLRTARNFFITEHGCAMNRAGTPLVDEMLGRARLRRFIFSDDQSYVLCFSNLKLRIASFGGMITAPTPGSLSAYAAGTTYGAGDWVASGGVSYISLQGGNLAHTPASSPTWWAAQGTLFEVATPYLEADLARLKIAQDGDVLTITHRSYAPQELKRYGHQSWVLGAVSFAAPASAFGYFVGVQAGTLAAPDSSHPLREWQWVVTTILEELATGRLVETAPLVVSWKWFPPAPFGGDPGATIWSMTTAYTAGQRVFYQGYWYDCAHANTGQSPPGNTYYWTLYHPPGPYETFTFVEQPVVLYPDKPVTLNWFWDGSGPLFSPPAGYRGVSWSVYRGRNGIFGWLGDTAIPEFKDDGTLPDFSRAPPQGTDPFAVYDAGGTVVAHSYPDVVTYFGQRRWFGRLGRLQGSNVGAYNNFDVSTPARADQAVDLPLSSHSFQEVRSLLGHDMLVPLTSSSAWSVRGSGAQEAITPTSYLARVGSERGAAWVDALMVDDVILHVTCKGTRVRELVYDVGLGRYAGGDLTVYAKHLFVGRTVIDWAYQEDPDSIVWCVLDNGSLISLTYMREQKLWAWTRHDTQGTVEAVCAVPEGAEDRLYLVVLRNGHRYLERMASRVVLDVRLGVFLDSALTYDGRNTGAATMTVTGGTTWEPDDEVTITASVATFASSNVGDAVVLDPDGAAIPLVITAFTSSTSVTARLDAAVPAGYRALATTSWGLAQNVMSGLTHLEGLAVNVLADGSPQGPFTVAGGTITLDSPSVIVHAGLGYDQELETLDFIGPPRSHVKSIAQVRMEIDGTKGNLEVGEELGADMQVWDQRRVEMGYGPVPLETLEAVVSPSSKWGTSGRVAIRNREPTPVTLMAVTREAEVGGR